MNSCLRPEYVSEFVCDGVTCPNNCCKRRWQIEIDAATYHKYEQLEPQAEAQALTSLFIRDDNKNLYRLKKRPCPLLTREGLCHLQLAHGENFLSAVCKTYPRIIFRFGQLYEQSLELSCPLAA